MRPSVAAPIMRPKAQGQKSSQLPIGRSIRMRRRNGLKPFGDRSTQLPEIASAGFVSAAESCPLPLAAFGACLGSLMRAATYLSLPPN
jgi:hypothetical protein